MDSSLHTWKPALQAHSRWALPAGAAKTGSRGSRPRRRSPLGHTCCGVPHPVGEQQGCNVRSLEHRIDRSERSLMGFGRQCGFPGPVGARGPCCACSLSHSTCGRSSSPHSCALLQRHRVSLWMASFTVLTASGLVRAPRVNSHTGRLGG